MVICKREKWKIPIFVVILDIQYTSHAGRRQSCSDTTHPLPHQHGIQSSELFAPVLRIRDILVRFQIRIRILGSVHLIYGSGSRTLDPHTWFTDPDPDLWIRTLDYGSGPGSSDPYTCLTDPDPTLDPALFVCDF